MNSALLLVLSCLPGDIHPRFDTFKVSRVGNRNPFLYYHFVIVSVQDKGSFSISLGATCDGHDMRMAQDPGRRKKEENGGLFQKKTISLAMAVAFPVQPDSHPSLSAPASHLLQAGPVSTVTWASGCGDITKTGCLWTR